MNNNASQRLITTERIETIVSSDELLAFIIRQEFDPAETTFITPPELKQQVGFIVYPGGGQIQRHVHRPLERHLLGTSEVIVVRKGRCEIDLYDHQRQFVTRRELRQGDIMLMVSGGHGFRMLEDTTLLEIKQGPYIGVDEKERF
jgi:hypothetical protein